MTSEYSVDMQANIYLCLAQEIMSKGLTGGSMGSEFVASEAEINLEAVDERIKEAVELDPLVSGSVKFWSTNRLPNSQKPSVMTHMKRPSVNHFNLSKEPLSFEVLDLHNNLPWRCTPF